MGYFMYGILHVTIKMADHAQNRLEISFNNNNNNNNNGCLGGRMKKLEEQMAKLIPEELWRLRITRETLKIVLMESETIVRKIISGIVQPE